MDSSPEAIPHHPEADSFHIGESLEVIKRAFRNHLILVIMVTAVTVGLVLAYVQVWPKTFQSEVMVAIDSGQDQMRNAFYQQWNIFRKDGMSEEATLLTSGPVLKQVIRELDLTYDDVYHPPMSYIVHLWGESWIGQNYRKIKYSIFPQPENPFAPSPEEEERYKVLKDFRAAVSVQQVGEASIGLVIVKGSNQRVFEIANTMVDVYLEQRRERYLEEARRAYDSLKEETDKALAELQEVEEEMRRFYSANDLLLLFEKDRVELGNWIGLRSAVTDLRAQIAEYTDALHVIRQQMAAESRHMKSNRVFQDNASKTRLTELEKALAVAKQQFQPDAPEVLELEEQIALEQGRIQEGESDILVRDSQRINAAYEDLRSQRVSIETQLAGAQAALAVKEEEQQRLHDLLQGIPQKMLVNKALERRQALLESKYQSLNEKLMLASVSMATVKSAPSALWVVEYAGPPDKPTWPKTKLLLAVALVFGGLAGLVGALLMELVFMRVSRDRIMRQGSGYRLFAVVNGDRRFIDKLYQVG